MAAAFLPALFLWYYVPVTQTGVGFVALFIYLLVAIGGQYGWNYLTSIWDDGAPANPDSVKRSAITPKKFLVAIASVTALFVGCLIGIYKILGGTLLVVIVGTSVLLSILGVLLVLLLLGWSMSGDQSAYPGEPS
mgnify:CR=1 FL=1